jgi:hypothetical protein
MATRSRTSFKKRQKELLRTERQREKAEKRLARKHADKQTDPQTDTQTETLESPPAEDAEALRG